MNERPIAAELDSPPPAVAELPLYSRQEAVFAAYPRIQAFVFSRLGEQEGEDVVAKVLEVLLRDIEKVTATTQDVFLSWCFGVARNKVMDAWRSQYRDRLQPMDPEDLVKYADNTGGTPGFSPGVREDLHFVLALLRAAKAPCVDLLQEHILLDIDYHVMAANYGIEVDAMRRRIERCFELAREIAKKHL